jgi:hypothetical protein
VAGAVEQHFDRLVAGKVEADRAVLVALDRGGADPMAEFDHVAVAHPLGVAHEGPPRAQARALVQGDADPRIAAAAVELGGDDARIVEHQHVAGAQQVGEIGDAAVAQPVPVDEQHPRRVARARGAKGDAVGRQLKVEQIDVHGLGGTAPAATAGGGRGGGGGGRRRGSGPPIVARTIFVGSAGGSPTAIASTAAMPSMTRPNALYL